MKTTNGGNDENAIWEVRSTGDGSTFYLIQYSTGRYVVCNGTMSQTQAVHLETTASPTDDAKFVFPTVSTDIYGIVPYIYKDNVNTDNVSFNPHGGQGKDIGLWAYNNDKASQWKFVATMPKVLTPRINVTEGTVSITCATEGATLHYTTDGTDPTDASTVYTGPFSVGAGVDIIKAIAYKTGCTESRIVRKFVTGYEPGYYALHQNGTGYLRVNSDNVSLTNNGSFRYVNGFSNDGNSLWVLTHEGYLKNGYYYLNVAGGTTPYLSVDAVTRWTLDELDDNGKMSIRYGDLYLRWESNTAKLSSNPDGYRACPVTLTENSWSGPTANDVTVQSPQLVTYLRHYFTQNFSYSFIDDGGTTRSENNKERRIYAELTYVSGGDTKSTQWDITADGIIYNMKATGNVAVTAIYSMASTDPLALDLHAPVNMSVKLNVTPKGFSPNDEKQYLLFCLSQGSHRFPFATDAMGAGEAVVSNGTKNKLTEPANGEISWKLELLNNQLFAIKNVTTGRYVYIDTAANSSTNPYGTLLLGATSDPSSTDPRYQFRLYKGSNDATYGSAWIIVPYSKMDAIYNSSGVANDLMGGLAVNTDNSVLSLGKGNDNKWRIYAYETEERLTSDWKINGPLSTTETGNNTFTANAYYLHVIKEAPTNDYELEIKDSHTKTGVTYEWSVTDNINAYTIVTDQSSNGNGKLSINVATLPPVTTVATLSVTARHAASGLSNSKSVQFTIFSGYTEPDASEFTEISSLAQITRADGLYRLTADASDAVPSAYRDFTGFLDGNGHTVSGLSAPLFNSLSGNARVRNLTLSEVDITGSGSIGAVACTATDGARIYNVGILDGTVGSTDGYCGSLIGSIDNVARVVNCYSYADVTSGTTVGGIVGFNSSASDNVTVTTIVMNCMYYGNATGTTVSPIYGGQIINNNSATGLNNFNYYFFDNFRNDIDIYNCALGAEQRFLNRFEFYRLILNSNRKLAAWYVNTTTDEEKMYKWVLDKAIAPYPILKPFGKYPSVINYDAASLKSLGTLTVNIGGVGSDAPGEAAVTTATLSLRRTGMDTANYNFNYDKVQLPYYNDIGTGNYTDNKVVTGWKVTSLTGGTPGEFTTGTDAPAYNFADRNCTQKDLYSVSGRVFSQGAYFDVPTGVTAITIEPYWGKATYLSDPNYDKTYSKDYGSGYNIATMGTRYINNTDYIINGSSQKVYTSMKEAISALGMETGKTVYDYAVVLVGNYHQYYSNSPIVNDTKGFTIMSADLDGDNEPDNCFFYQHQQRQVIAPIRFDFLCWPGIGMAQKPSDSPRMPSIGIFKTKGWFEVTNTCIARFTEVEYDNNDQNKVVSPLIFMGGIIEQIVSTNKGTPDRNQYMILGGNVWFKMFNNGTHADGDKFTPHHPISVSGGDYDAFYLSGMFKPTAAVSADNAECYISGGRFGELAGSGQEQINGNVTWQIYAAEIGRFFGGGINAAKPVTGSIDVTIEKSHVDLFCGGPKFGDMSSGKTVTVNATDCTFGNYFGAGYGGTSYNREQTRNVTTSPNYTFSNWAMSDYTRQYNSAKGGIATHFEYEHFAYAGFADNNNVGRFYINYASLSMATTHNVTSTLRGCTVKGDFYGGGNLGKVDGTVTSTLTDCTVLGNIFGAGYSATAPTVDVMPKPTSTTAGTAGAGFVVEPYYDGNDGTYTIGVTAPTVTYTWKHVTSVSEGHEFEDDGDNHYILTTVDMSTLGTVMQDITLTLDGNTTVGTLLEDHVLKEGTGNVYGGGNEGPANSNTTVLLKDNVQVHGNVFGGGHKAVVGGNTHIIIGAE